MSPSPLANISVGFGTMSLSIKQERPSEDEAIALIGELIDQGLRFIDTADCYSLGEADFGYGERIVAPFMKHADLLVATKGGMIRPEGRWERRGDAKYLRSACEASLARLGTEQIELYQFHAPDKQVPIEESLGELVRLQKEGKIKNIGVSNFSLDELKAAKEIADVVSVQNPLSILFYEPEQDNGILRYCEEKNIAFIAYAPLGGHRNPYILSQISEDFNELAAKLSITPFQLALLRLQALSPSIIPIPGSVSKQHVLDNIATERMSLSADVIAEVDAIIAKAKSEE
jgi:aryl-alcohol dehydrogenase-like predicted oxidoreductase